MNNLEINRETRADEIVLKCIGRLDANQAGHLNDYIGRLVREGCYHIALDMTGIEYLSSAGIRSLVTQYKNLKSINGHFYISSMSDNVKQVLNMVGMIQMLGSRPQEIQKEATKQDALHSLAENGFTFKIDALASTEKADLFFYGEPGLIRHSAFQSQNARLVKSEENHFAIGLGAIGESFDECKNRMGEYMMMGKSIAYLPADGSKKPDYMVSSGQLVAAITELYGIHFQGNFTRFITFEPDTLKNTIRLSQLVETIQKMTGFKKMAVVMIAESGGLIGTSLNASPIEGKKIFSFPEIKEAVNFTTEPAHNKMLTLTIGCFAQEENVENADFLRPLQGGSATWAHVHSAVFPYIPLKKTDIHLNEAIDALFENAELTDMLHLINDKRETTGLGESLFVHGFCWIVPIESTHTLSSK